MIYRVIITLNNVKSPPFEWFKPLNFGNNSIMNGIIMNGEQVNVKRGELYYADLSPVIGSEQGGLRPVLVVQNDIGNRYSPTIIVSAVTSQMNKARLPTHIELSASTGLTKNSVVLLEQIRTIDKTRLKGKIGEINDDTMKRVNNALLISLGFFA